MKNTPYLEFKKFTSIEQANELTEMLGKNSIDFVLDELPGTAYVLSSNPTKEYHVKLLPKDFEKVKSLLLEQSARKIETIDKRYYLNSLSDEELKDIVAKPEEWNEFDFLAAQKILKERGKEINPAQLAEMQKERSILLAKPETVTLPWIILGYAIGLLGGPIAILSGWHLLRHKKTLPNGKTVSSYSSYTRTHGLIMMMLGIISLLSWIIIWIVRNS